MDPLSPVFRKVDRPMNEQLLLLMGKVKLGRVSFLENKHHQAGLNPVHILASHFNFIFNRSSGL